MDLSRPIFYWPTREAYLSSSIIINININANAPHNVYVKMNNPTKTILFFCSSRIENPKIIQGMREMGIPINKFKIMSNERLKKCWSPNKIRIPGVSDPDSNENSAILNTIAILVSVKRMAKIAVRRTNETKLIAQVIIE